MKVVWFDAELTKLEPMCLGRVDGRTDALQPTGEVSTSEVLDEADDEPGDTPG